MHVRCVPAYVERPFTGRWMWKCGCAAVSVCPLPMSVDATCVDTHSSAAARGDHVHLVHANSLAAQLRLGSGCRCGWELLVPVHRVPEEEGEEGGEEEGEERGRGRGGRGAVHLCR